MGIPIFNLNKYEDSPQRLNVLPYSATAALAHDVISHDPDLVPALDAGPVPVLDSVSRLDLGSAPTLFNSVGVSTSDFCPSTCQRFEMLHIGYDLEASVGVMYFNPEMTTVLQMRLGLYLV
ncbi:hypothetical protein EVAR_43372_1 [Eumeta japonica]|uniref:Uncharacterized protein n=1 Tax=Eumeta variegata TaxID=151549 RepID=A0A4C1WNM2_EUMVA|nr:hypothetical protein EVAR_43372_1 [Eumeta japonica]